MKASVEQNERVLIGVISSTKELIVETNVPVLLNQGYTCVVLTGHGNVSLVSQNLQYWAEKDGSTPIYEELPSLSR